MPLSSMEHQNWEGMYPNLFPRKFQKLNFFVRFVIGRPLDNKARTDGSFWHAATKGYPSRWLRLPGYVRSLVRLSSLYAVALAVVLWGAGWLGFRDWQREVVLWHLLVLLSLFSLVVLVKLVRERGVILPALRWEEREDRARRPSLAAVRLVEGRGRWEREHVVPLARVLAPLMQIEHRRLRPAEARKWVLVPRSYLSPKGQPVSIALPAHFSGTDEKHNLRVVKTASAALGALEMVPTWQLAGTDRRLLLSAPELPPEKILYRDVLPHLLAGEEYRPLLGMVSPEKSLRAEMIADSPHILLSAGPGAGKSSLLKVIVMQAMHWGWGILVLDWKRTDQFDWLRGMRGVKIVNDLEGIHDMGVRIGEEVELRMADGGMEGKTKMLVVRDEWNVTATLLAEYWTHYRATLEPEERRVTPVRSPALMGFNKLDFAGREYWMHDLLSAQKASNRIFNFNTDMRDCFNIRLIARYSPEAKRMLVGNMKPFPKKSNLPGRWTVVTGDQVSVVQAPLVTGEEAREFAEGGVLCPIGPFGLAPEVDDSGSPSVRAYVGPTLEKPLSDRLTGSSDSLPILDGTVVESVRGRKLSDLAESLAHLGVTKRILQHAAGDSSSGFPPAISGSQFKGYEYDPYAVREWARARVASIEARKGNAR